MLGSPAGPGGGPQRGLWPLAPAPASTATTFSTDGISKYGVYSLFPGGPTFGSALYSHASTIGRFASGHIQQSSSGNAAAAFHHAAHKVSDSLFSATGYTFGAPTPPPGSPYSPIPVTQLELLTKGYSTNNIIIQQAQEFPPSPKKVQITEKRCDEKCCSIQKAAQRSCLCPGSPVKKITEISTTGCSRTNPIEWTGVNVKKEPGTPCQVAEITTSMSPVVKLEVTSPTQKGDVMMNNGAQIPVGIAVARQRVQHELVAAPSASMPPAGLLATVSAGGGGGATIKEFDNAAAAISSMAAGSPAAGGGPILQCTDERGAAAGLAAFQIGGNHHGQALATPTLWQYPAPVPMEPMVPLPVPTMPPVGFQLVRDPTTGGLLLLPTTTGIAAEPLQQTVVWPSYPQASSVLLPSLSSMQPPPLQLLSSASSDYLSSHSTTLHQHTQTHSTRLVAVTTDAKRKMSLPLPATTLIKIETDASLDQAKALQAVSTIANNNSAVFTTDHQSVHHQPLVTTHVIYQHPATNLIVSQTPMSDATCRSQATSPVATCLTPPPDSVQIHEEEMVNMCVQDANIQTDTPICSEDDNTSYAMGEGVGEEKIKEIDSREEAEPVITDAPEEPVLPVEEEVADKPKPDLSGLELLSNSIMEFENHRPEPAETSTTESTSVTSEDSVESTVVEEVQPAPVALDDNLGGLDLLCALAEQRILEENIEKPEKKEKRKERRREKRKSKKHSSDEPKRKKMKHKDREHRKRDKRSDREEKTEREECSCKYKHYKTPQSEQDAKKFLESKAAPSYCCKGEWPCMNAMELDMRMKLAELQREYKEKQKELSKLKPKKHHHECSRKSRKKSTHSERSNTPPPPQLDKMETNQERTSSDLLRPPLLSVMPKLGEVHKRRHSETDSSPEKHSSASKKRKVGRPKRIMSALGEIVGTETIVAKKVKNNFVGCLLAAKEKIKQKSARDSTPPRFVEEPYTHKLKKVMNNNTIIVEDDDNKSSKIRPKLRAEATVKMEEDDEEAIIDHIDADIDEDEEVEEEEDTSNENFSETLLETSESTVNNDRSGRTEESDREEEVAKENGVKEESLCALTEDLLETDKLRVLTAMGGLFYAGRLNAVEPPDVYSITLDGERGNRPHIMSREEILRDAIVEVSPKSTEELPAGTRLCAYWSQQYRCLYPGSAAEPGTPNPQLDGKFVSVEFDDGDSGRIALQDIRLLPPNYPIMEYDPNPLLSLCKRRRRTSTTEEKHPPEPTPECTKKPDTSETTGGPIDSEHHQKEKKRLKKKKKEKIKLKSDENKKKRRKHKCADEFCKHKRHHKKHKKHRKHHEKSKTDSSEDSSGRQEFVCEIISEEKEEEEVKVELLAGVRVEENDESSQQSSCLDDYPNYEAPANPDDEVTMDDILEANGEKKSKKLRDRQESCESRSKMSAFLPARQLWHWAGKGYKRPRAKGKSKKCFYRAIERGKESITVGDAAVFLSTGRPDRPYIGRIEAMWELCGTMAVKVKWFYHPEETVGCPANLQYPGALFESPHIDENDVQTISHKCEVLPLKDYVKRLGNDPARYATIYDNNDIYYLAGHYDPTVHTLRMEPGIPFSKSD